MKKRFALLLLIISVHVGYSQQKKILIVSTNRDSVGTNASGTFLKEIAYPFQHFINQGFEVDILTPKGGKAAIYHWGNTPNELESIQKSALFLKKTQFTLAPSQIKAQEYVAIFYPGGHGQYFDVIDDERIAHLAAQIHENNGVVGTAGHGAASLINIRLSNGNYLVDGKRLTCFPHWAELALMNISNYGKLLAFDMQEVLARRGADVVVCTRENRSEEQFTLVADVPNRLVTGAFASSAQWVAEQMVSIINSSTQALPSEVSLILAAANHYVEGRNNGNIERLRSAFHPSAALKSVNPQSGVLTVMPVEDYIARNVPGTKHQCQTDVRLLSYKDHVAIVNVVLTYSTYAYHDYLVLMKVGGNWIITDKIYTKVTL